MGKGGATRMTDDQMLRNARWATLAVSFLTALFGIALIGLGVYGLLNPLGSAMVPMTLPIVTIATGAAVILISILGCIGSAMEYRTLLWIYFSLLAFLVLAQFVVGTIALRNTGNAVTDLADRRWSYLYDRTPGNIRTIEERYECCGFRTVHDRPWPKGGNGKRSCVDDSRFGYRRPCWSMVREEWEDRQKVFGIGVLVLAGLQLLGLIPTFYLAWKMPTAEDRDRQLIEEHRHLLARRGEEYGAGWDTGRPQPGSTVQHPIGGPAGAYPYPSSRPGSRGVA